MEISFWNNFVIVYIYRTYKYLNTSTTCGVKDITEYLLVGEPSNNLIITRPHNVEQY